MNGASDAISGQAGQCHARNGPLGHQSAAERSVAGTARWCLAKRESEGLERGQCLRVAKTLAQLAEEASALTAEDAAWKTALQRDLVAFQEIFVAHNMDLTNKDEAIENRAVTLVQLRAIRQKLSDRIRRNLAAIEHDADIRGVEAMVARLRRRRDGVSGDVAAGRKRHRPLLCRAHCQERPATSGMIDDAGDDAGWEKFF